MPDRFSKSIYVGTQDLIVYVLVVFEHRLSANFSFQNIEFTSIRRTRIHPECKTESRLVFVSDSQTSATARSKKRSNEPPYKSWTPGVISCRNDNSDTVVALNLTSFYRYHLATPQNVDREGRSGDTSSLNSFKFEVVRVTIKGELKVRAFIPY